MDKESPKLTPPDSSGTILMWLQDVMRQARLAWRLFWDQRVPLWTKTIPPAVLAYVLFPADIITDLAPGVGQLDDLAVILLGIKLFVNLAPPEVVKEHLRELGAQIEEWHVMDDESPTVDGEYEVKK